MKLIERKGHLKYVPVILIMFENGRTMCPTSKQGKYNIQREIVQRQHILRLQAVILFEKIFNISRYYLQACKGIC